MKYVTKKSNIPSMFTVILFLAAINGARAENVRNIFDARIPMHDGVELSADIWLPSEKGFYPAILIRTPYVKSLRQISPPKRDILPIFAEHGYAVVYQDVRGRGDSDGKFLYGDQGPDGYDTIEWIARQSWSNGDVCMMGLSYLGSVQWAAARRIPPHLQCIAPTASGSTRQINNIGGAFNLEFVQWANSVSGRMHQYNTGLSLDWDKIYKHRPLLTLDEAIGRPIPIYRKLLKNRDPMYDIVSGKSLSEDDYRKINIPVLHISGWFDSALPSTLEFWHGMMEYSQAREDQYLIIGPWDHAQTFLGGDTKIGEMELTPNSVLDMLELHLRFFDHFLKGETKDLDFPRVQLYLTGSNEWQYFDTYPPRASKEQRIYLHSGGNANSLAGDGKLGWAAPADEPADQYSFDPHQPVPSTVEGTLNYRSQSNARDHRPIERRNDVLVYTSEVLDIPLKIIGKVTVELYAATDGRDTDFTARLIDVYPDDRAVKLGSPITGVVRARFRNGLDKEELLTPGKVIKYRISLSNIGHTFLPGHKVRLEISSSAYPLINPNQNTGNPIETDIEWRVAEQTIYHNRIYPSAIILPVFK